MPERARGLWARLGGPFRDFGALAGTLYLIDRALRTISPQLAVYAYELMVQPIADKPLLPPSVAQHLTYRLIEAGDAEVAEMPARPEIKAQRFAQGHQCVAAYLKGRWVGYLWFARGHYNEDELRCRYLLAEPEISVFDFDLVVLPSHRMGVGFAAVWDAANRHFGGLGIRQSFSRVTRYNLASRRAHAHLGCQRLGRMAVFKAGRVECLCATVAPYLALSLRPDVVPCLPMRPVRSR